MRPLSILVCGPKGSGKSTFGRMLVNALLTRSDSSLSKGSSARIDGVAFLDLDPGQPEFSAPGEVSLIYLRACSFGPPFTHPYAKADDRNSLIRAHHYGGLSPKNNPEYYARCAEDLFSRYKELLVHSPSCPLVVNCAGWIQGTGLEVLLDLINLRCLTDIVYTSTRGPLEVVESITEIANQVRIPLHFLSSQGPEIATKTAADLRVMQTLSYFHLDEPEAGNLRWSPTPISEQAPLVVHWSGDKQALFAVMTLDDDLDPDTLTNVLDSSIIGLVVIEDDGAMPDDSNPNITYGRKESRKIEGAGLTNNAVQQHQDCTYSFPTASENMAEPNVLPPHSQNFNEIGPSDVKAREEHLGRFIVARNADEIPYVRSERRSASPLDPTRSYSLGQALIRGIDHENKCFYLLTPVPEKTLVALHRQKTKIVLVWGSLDTPTWASREDLEQGASLRRRLRKRYPEAADRFDAQDAREWAARTPYANAIDQRVKSVSGKVWRVRRDLKPRASGDEMN